jgi:hypothetical protein
MEKIMVAQQQEITFEIKGMGQYKGSLTSNRKRSMRFTAIVPHPHRLSAVYGRQGFIGEVVKSGVLVTLGKGEKRFPRTADKEVYDNLQKFVRDKKRDLAKAQVDVIIGINSSTGKARGFFVMPLMLVLCSDDETGLYVWKYKLSYEIGTLASKNVDVQFVKEAPDDIIRGNITRDELGTMDLIDTERKHVFKVRNTDEADAIIAEANAENEEGEDIDSLVGQVIEKDDYTVDNNQSISSQSSFTEAFAAAETTSSFTEAFSNL